MAEVGHRSPGAPVSNRMSGSALVTSAAAMWGISYFLTKLVSDGLDPILFTLVVAIVSTLFAFLISRPTIRDIVADFRRTRVSFIFLGLFGMTGGTLLLFMAMKTIPLGIVSVLAKLEPVFTVIFARFILGEQLVTRQKLLLGIAIVASAGVASPDLSLERLHKIDAFGLTAVILAATCWGLSTVLGRFVILRGASPDRASILRFVIGTLFLLPFLPLVRTGGASELFQNFRLPITILNGIVAGIGYMIFYRGLRTTPASVAGALELITPIVASSLGLVFLADSWTNTQFASAALLLISVYQLSRPRK